MNINKITEPQKIQLFKSLKKQYESSGLKNMTTSEYDTLNSLECYFWNKNGGKFGIGGRVRHFKAD